MVSSTGLPAGYDIGTTTTNAMGVYGLTWTPPIPGDFTIYADFEGSNSYYPSSAATLLYASAAQATPEATPIPASVADIYFLPMSIVILVAIIIATIVMVLMLRKR